MDSVTIRVVGISWECWKCEGATRCVVGPYREGEREILTGDRARLLAREVLEQAGQNDLAALLVQHYYRDGTEVGIASDCEACGALQGDFYVRGEAWMRIVDADGGLDDLDVIAEGLCDEAVWNQLSADDDRNEIPFFRG